MNRIGDIDAMVTIDLALANMGLEPETQLDADAIRKHPDHKLVRMIDGKYIVVNEANEYIANVVKVRQEDMYDEDM